MIKWFAVHRAFALIATILLVLVILLIASYSLRNKDNVIGDVSRSVITVVQKPFSALFTGIGNAIGGVFSNDELVKENEKLNKKVDELSSELATSRLGAQELEELKNLSDKLSGNKNLGDKKLKAANILSYEGSTNLRIFTIDMGSEEGIERNSVVLSGDGLVGRVLSSEKGWARVVCIIDETNNVGFQIGSDKQKFLGVLHGDGSGKLSGYLLDENGTAKEGDEVYTSGIGGIYPGGIKIGTVTDAKIKGDSPLLNVEVDPAVYFKGMKKVAILV